MAFDRLLPMDYSKVALDEGGRHGHCDGLGNSMADAMPSSVATWRGHGLSRLLQMLRKNNSSPHSRRLRVVVLSNRSRRAARDHHRPGNSPDPERLHKLLADRGIDLIDFELFPFPWNPLPRSIPFFAGLDPLRALVVLLRHRSADLVVSVFESGAVPLVLLRWLFLFRPPLALWDTSIGSTWRPKQWALQLVLPRVERLFALTSWQGRAAETNYRLRASAQIIGYAVDELFFHPQFNGNPDFILSVGEDSFRDYSTLIAATKDLAVKVVLKTSRPVELPLEQSGSIMIERTYLSDLQLRDLYAAASIFVLPLRLSYNPSGITSLFEAMAMGRPIIASDVPTMREFITDGHTGILVPVGDAKAMRAAIEKLLASPSDRERLGTNARRRLESDFGMAVFADRFAACMKDCLEPRSS